MSSSPEPLRAASVTISEPPPRRGAYASGFEDTSSAPPRVVAVASRVPVQLNEGSWRAAPGGLAPIVSKALDDRGGAWVGWDGGTSEPPPQQIDGLNYDILTFSIAHAAAEGFYAGYANRTLWPLLHDAVVPPVFDSRWWHAYESASRAYTLSAAIAADRLGGNPTIWVHDYHLFLVPQMLREAGLTNPISFFLHTPFPSPSIFARLPEREEIMNGLAGADLVGFHTEADRQRFLATWSQFGMSPAPQTVAVPASIDTDAFATAARSPQVTRAAKDLRRRLNDRILLFGVERLDYTKGLPERLRAIEVLLSRRPDLRRRLVYVQVAPPSRDQVPEYQQLRADVEREIGRLNGKFTLPGYDVPIRYIHRRISQEQLMAYYVAADVGVVTPLKDGMNLVAKEFVVSQAAAKGKGVLVLSEFAGAAAEMTDALQCNPFDPEGTADTLEAAMDMSDEERRKRLAILAVNVENNDIGHWSDQLLRCAESRQTAIPC